MWLVRIMKSVMLISSRTKSVRSLGSATLAVTISNCDYLLADEWGHQFKRSETSKSGLMPIDFWNLGIRRRPGFGRN